MTSIYADITDGFKRKCHTLLREGYHRAKEEDKYEPSWKEEQFTQQIVKHMKEIRVERGFNGYIIAWNAKTATDRTLSSNFNPDAASKVDIKVDRFRGKEINYFIECKRLDGNPKLARKYCKKGIKRFVDGKYSENFSEGAMAGYVITEDRGEAVDELKDKLEMYQEKLLTVEGLEFLKETEKKGFIEEFVSSHKRKKNLPEIELRHFVMEFS